MNETLSTLAEQMQQKIAKILDIKKDMVNIKAKTNEGLGEIGNKEAIASYAVVLIDKR